MTFRGAGQKPTRIFIDMRSGNRILSSIHKYQMIYSRHEGGSIHGVGSGFLDGSARPTQATGGYRLKQFPQGPPSFLGLHFDRQHSATTHPGVIGYLLLSPPTFSARFWLASPRPLRNCGLLHSDTVSGSPELAASIIICIFDSMRSQK